MAGSYEHLLGKTGKFTMDNIENLGDAHEALQHCYFIIKFLEKSNLSIKQASKKYFKTTMEERDKFVE